MNRGKDTYYYAYLKSGYWSTTTRVADVAGRPCRAFYSAYQAERYASGRNVDIAIAADRSLRRAQRED